MNGINFNTSVNEFCDSLVYATGNFNNCRELKEGEQVFFSTFSMYRTIPKDETQLPTIVYEFGTSILTKLEYNNKKCSKREGLELIKFVGFYKSNNPMNCNAISNYYILLYRLNSEIKVFNKTLFPTTF